MYQYPTRQFLGKVRLIVMIMILIIVFELFLFILLYQPQGPAVKVQQLNRTQFLQKRLVPIDRKADSTIETLDVKPDIDKRPSLFEDKQLADIAKRIPSLPIAAWSNYKNKSRANVYDIFNLEHNNIYWQTLKTSNGTFQLYGAYLDVRNMSNGESIVRILGMIDRSDPSIETYCQLWFEDIEQPVFSKIFEYNYMWYKYWSQPKIGSYQPYLISCTVPEKYKFMVPDSVSLAENPSDNVTNNLRVIYDKPADDEKKNFAVCVKGLDFLHEDISVKLVEWIELIGLLGADKIFFYQLHVHPNISKVLKHYEGAGKVHLTPISLPGSQPNLPSLQHLYLNKNLLTKRLNELIPYNDCFYKHMYEYKYIAMLDVDEIIIPTKVSTWMELIDIVLKKAPKQNKTEATSYCARNVYFWDELTDNQGLFRHIPKYMHMLQHVYRTRNFTRIGYNMKCFHNTERVLTLHNHYPMKWLSDYCRPYNIELVDARLHHYQLKMCKKLNETGVMDTSVWKYMEPLTKRVLSTLKTLNFFPDKKLKEGR